MLQIKHAYLADMSMAEFVIQVVISCRLMTNAYSNSVKSNSILHKHSSCTSVFVLFRDFLVRRCAHGLRTFAVTVMSMYKLTQYRPGHSN